MPSTRPRRSSRTTKSTPCCLNASTGAGAPGRGAALREQLDVLAGDVWVLLGARQRELLLDDRLSQHEPRVVVSAREDRLERAERVEPGKFGASRRLPVASSHSDDGPGMMRIP